MKIADDKRIYTADRILKHRKRKGRTDYLIKWQGWPTKYSTWEPLENIFDKSLITTYRKSSRQAKEKRTKRLRIGRQKNKTFVVNKPLLNVRTKRASDLYKRSFQMFNRYNTDNTLNTSRAPAYTCVADWTRSNSSLNKARLSSTPTDGRSIDTVHCSPYIDDPQYMSVTQCYREEAKCYCDISIDSCVCQPLKRCDKKYIKKTQIKVHEKFDKCSYKTEDGCIRTKRNKTDVSCHKKSDSKHTDKYALDAQVQLFQKESNFQYKYNDTNFTTTTITCANNEHLLAGSDSNTIPAMTHARYDNNVITTSIKPVTPISTAKCLSTKTTAYVRPWERNENDSSGCMLVNESNSRLTDVTTCSGAKENSVFNNFSPTVINNLDTTVPSSLDSTTQHSNPQISHNSTFVELNYPNSQSNNPLSNLLLKNQNLFSKIPPDFYSKYDTLGYSNLIDIQNYAESAYPQSHLDFKRITLSSEEKTRCTRNSLESLAKRNFSPCKANASNSQSRIYLSENAKLRTLKMLEHSDRAITQPLHVTVTDVTCNSVTVTFLESPTDDGFFKAA